MEPLRNRRPSELRGGILESYSKRGFLVWVRRYFNGGLRSIIALSLLTIVGVFLLWGMIKITISGSNVPAEPPVNLVVQFALDSIRSMGSRNKHHLVLVAVLSHITETENIPGVEDPINTVHDLILRICSSVNRDIAFDHHITVSTDSSGVSAITKYTCDYGVESPGYPDVYLPGSTMNTGIGSSRQLRVLSVNTWNYNHWIKRLPLLAEQFNTLLPDVITFQEVRARKVSNQPRNRFMSEDLRSLLPDMQFAFQPAMRFKDGNEIVHEGLAIFSRFPISQITFKKLSQNHGDGADFHQRIALHAAIRWNGGLMDASTVHVITTHLSLSETARARTIPEVYSMVQSLSADGTQPVVLTGDFNAESADVEHLLPKMVDTWKAKHSEDEHAPSGLTFNSWYPESRIDFIFTTPQLSPIYSSVVGGGPGQPVPGGLAPGFGVDYTRNVIFPSDHMFPFAILERT
uniref:Endonuclease/exonuclease/phosphatase domain-containing protein n=1 Tax=Spongospora subterranea TaxID=70186 RepID=A0A0H5R5I8_9EUKA|eukprot:CRZ09042.1 hypothetical protein [Spongospora subterranea]